MKKRILFSLVVVMALLWSCTTTMKYTWTKENFEGKSFDKILVLTLSKNLKSRTLFENTVVEMLADEGITATNGLMVITPVEDVKKLTEAEIEKRIREGGYDGVLVTTLIDINTRDVRVNNYNYYPYMYGGRYGYRYGNKYYTDGSENIQVITTCGMSNIARKKPMFWKRVYTMLTSRIQRKLLYGQGSRNWWILPVQNQLQRPTPTDW